MRSMVSRLRRIFLRHTRSCSQDWRPEIIHCRILRSASDQDG